MSGNQMILLGGNPQQAAVDPYFYSVTSLLHGDGTNGGQNNTFLDSSSNNFTITRNGNTTQGSFSPFSQTGWGNYFNGSTDELTTSTSVLSGVGSSNFSIECFVYALRQTNTYGQGLVSYGISGQIYTTSVLTFDINASGYLQLALADGSAPTLLSPGLVPINQWVHVVACRSGSTISLFINGIRVATGTTSATVGSSGDRMVVGGQWYAAEAARRLQGYLSNVRVVTGASAYDATQTTLTVPTSPLTGISGTSLLTCQSNRFRDASTNNFVITVTGSPSVQPFSPFNPITPYSTSAVGGSGYFDGSGDYLTITSATAFDMTGDFTVEMWVYPITLNASNGATVFSCGTTNLFQFNTIASGTKIEWYATTSTPSISVSYSGYLQLSQWNHLVVCRTGTTLAIFVNGTRLGTATDNTSYDLSQLYLSYQPGSSHFLNGYMGDVRVIKGSGPYNATQSTLTVPTAPLTAITNTQLLCNFTNGAIFDNAADADYETVGNAQISTSVKKYGTGSIAFDGNGDWLQTPVQQNFVFGTGDFTVEFWLYANALAGYQNLFDGRAVDATLFPVLWLNGTAVEFYANGSVRASATVATSTWYHIALCRTASQTKLFVNGTQVGSTYADTNNYVAGSVLYVSRYAPSATNYLNGYIDDLRVSKGVGRYPYNFTPPTAEFPNIGGTVTLTADPYFEYTTLLLPGNGTNGAQNNTFLDSSTNAFSITRNGNTTQGTFSPFSQTGWGNYFDGSSDYLSVADNAAFELGSGDFTIEAWIYLTAFSGTYGGSFYGSGICGKDSVSNRSYALQVTASGTSSYTGFAFVLFHSGGSAAIISATASVGLNTWYHVAVSRQSGTCRIFLNGTQIGSGSLTQTADDYSAPFVVGASGIYTGFEYFFPGYISNLRLVKGTAVYTSNFTPPTAPLTAITNTSLLTCQSNRFIDNSSNNFTITRNGDVSVQAFSPFNPTAAWSAATNGGSGYFDGSGDLLTVSSANQILPSGTQNFSVEFYTYFVSAPGLYPIFLESKEATNGFQIVYVNDGGANQNKLGIGVYGVGILTAATFNTYFRQWVHVVATRNGNDFRLFFNGTLVAYASNSQSFVTVGTQTIGAQASGLYPTNAYIANIRTCLGAIPTDYQTSSTTTGTQIFTPPSAPVTTTSQGASSVAFLANFTNAGIYDATSKNDLETVGNAQISTTQSKFGGSSMYFDGTGDYLYRAANPNPLGSGDWTIEFWYYQSGGSSYRAAVSTRTAADGGATATVFCGFFGNNMYYDGSTSGGINVVGSTTIANSTWYHCAYVRFGSTVTMYLNGVSQGSVSDSNNKSNPDVWVGGQNTLYYLNGYIDDLRITKGIARYTSNFTPPTTAFLTL